MEALANENQETSHLTRTALKEQRRCQRLERENEKKQKERLKALEQEIHDLEEKIKLLELKMADPTLYENTDKMLDVQQEYDNNKKDSKVFTLNGWI